jgi:hypothetical protein
MIHQRPATTDIARTGPWVALLLAASLTVGFIAGQVTPDLLGPIFDTPARIVTTDALTGADDYGIRHLGVTTPLSEADDYATRHGGAAPLTPADDYGIRHGASQP